MATSKTYSAQENTMFSDVRELCEKYSIPTKVGLAVVNKDDKVKRKEITFWMPDFLSKDYAWDYENTIAFLKEYGSDADEDGEENGGGVDSFSESGEDVLRSIIQRRIRDDSRNQAASSLKGGNDGGLTRAVRKQVTRQNKENKDFAAEFAALRARHGITG